MPDDICQLEAFLKGQSQQGERLDTGQFTVDVELALEKLAAFQLPFAGAWILKIVQAAVASGVSRAIEIKLTNNVATITFDQLVPWTTNSVQEAILSATPTSESGYAHLAMALRAVAIRDKRPFSLAIPEPTEMSSANVLVWDGHEFVHAQWKSVESKVVLTVTHRGVDDGGSLFARVLNKKARAENAALTRVLASRCFACPVPLTLDGRCLTSFLANPLQGLTSTSFPYEVSWHEIEGLPSWSIPQSQLRLPRGTGRHYYKNFDQFIEDHLASELPPPETSVVHFLCAHFKMRSGQDNIAWETTEGNSQCYWILDGILIDQESSFETPTGISSCLYLSAEGLETDLTGFQLQKSEDRAQRLRKALRAVNLTVQESNFKSFVLQQEGQEANPWLSGAGGVVAAVVFVGLKPITIPAALFLGALSICAVREAETKENEHVKTLYSGLEHLQDLFRGTLESDAGDLAHVQIVDPLEVE